MIMIRNVRINNLSKICRLHQFRGIRQHTNALSTQRSKQSLLPRFLVRRSSVLQLFVRSTMSSSPPEVLCNQPLDALLLNKIDTQQEEFLRKNPEYDGRGIIIAILDTGVDPSLPGMLVTTTGERKMIDVIDCTGAGDVDTSTVRSNKNGFIEGLSGRKLEIPEKWVCPTGQYHIGIKPIYELYTEGVKSKIMAERKEDSFLPSQNLSTADALKKLVEHETEVGGSSEKVSDKWQREELASRIDFLKSMQSASDVGPVADVLVWHDGNIWRACIDTSFRGKLGMCKVLGSFKETGDYGFITGKDSVAYTVRISNDGKLCEIAVPSGSHGSHVAGIAAANYPDNPEKNGNAPGAKLISLNIGDHRLGSMETGQAMTRAFNFCAEKNVDIINMSFGEGTHLPDVGRVIEEAQKLINRNKVIYVCSAGNNGPALSTVGAPGGTTTNVIGIGAYLTSETADTLYGVHKNCESNVYPFSSRGPCHDGKLGVSIVAPAAAFANVPKYCRKSMQMMNGTSMSSPNAAGNVACILSGLKKQELTWTPYTVRLALENTAQPLPQSDSFSAGYGMIKTDDAFERLSTLSREELFPNRLTHFEIEVNDHQKKSKGIYMREPSLKEPREFLLTVEPVFNNYFTNDNEEAIQFEKQLILQSTAPWVSHPQTYFTVAQASNFSVHVDASLAPKGASYTEIVGIDAANPSIGPVLRIPVTVIVPEEITDVKKGYNSKLVGKSGTPERRFLKVPDNATSAVITLKSTDKQPLDRFLLSTVYVENDKCYRNTEAVGVQGPNGNEWKKALVVKGGKTLEVCICRPWTRGPNAVDIDMKIDFFGVQKPDIIPLLHGATSTPIQVKASSINSFTIKPVINLTSLVTSLKVQSSKIEPLGEKDVYVTSGLQINRILNTYKFNALKPCEVSLEFSGLSTYLYESPVDDIFFQIFGANKSYVSACGPYGARYKHKLEKGEYTIQAQIRYPDEQALEKFKELPLLVRTHLVKSSHISVDLSANPRLATFGKSSKLEGRGLLPNQEITLYATSINEDKLPKNVSITSGSFLTGVFQIFQDKLLEEVDKVPVIYYLSEYSSRPAKGLSMVTTKKDKNQVEEMKESIRDLEVGWISKLTDEKAATALFDSCVEKYPDHIPLLQNRVKQIMQTKLTDMKKENITSAIQLAAKILELTKPAEVLQFNSIKQEHADDLLTVEKWIALTGGDESQKKEAASTISKFDERKTAIIVALQALASFEQDYKIIRSKENVPTNIRFGSLTPYIFGGKSEVITHKKKSTEYEELEKKVSGLDTFIEEELKKIDPKWTGTQYYVRLLTWLAVDDTKAALVSVKHAAALGQFGRCAKLLLKVGDEMKQSANDTKVIDTALVETCDELGWVHLSTHLRNVMLVKNRPSFRLF